MAAVPFDDDKAFPYPATAPSTDGQIVSQDQWMTCVPYFGCTDGVGTYGHNVGGGFLVTANSSGLEVHVATGECWIRGQYGYHTDVEDLAITGTIPSGGQARIARVVLRNRLVDKRIEMDVLQGTNATIASVTAPALTQNSTIWEMSIAQVYIAASVSTITAGAVTEERKFARSHSGLKPGQILYWPTATGFPTGTLYADGTAYSRITYSELAAIVDPGGTSATFTVPDYRGEVLAGLDNMGGGAAGRLSSMASLTAHYGAQTHTLTSVELATHAHAMPHTHAGVVTDVEITGTPKWLIDGGVGTVQGSTVDDDGGVVTGSTGGVSTPNTSTNGSNTAHNNVQPTHMVYVLIGARPV